MQRRALARLFYVGLTHAMSILLGCVTVLPFVPISFEEWLNGPWKLQSLFSAMLKGAGNDMRRM
jgi:hypothetical protein